MNKNDNILYKLCKQNSNYEKVIEFGRKAIYFTILVSIFQILPIASEVFGDQNTIPEIYIFSPDQLVNSITLPIRHMLSNFPVLFCIVLSLLLIFQMIHQGFWATKAAIWILAWALLSHNQFLFDGGDRLTLQILNIFLIFDTIKLFAKNDPAIKGAINFLFITSLRLQVCLMYMCASLNKFGGELWPNGLAIHYVSQIEEYSFPLLANFLGQNILLSSILTYIVLFYQLSFPFLIWNKFARRYILFLGAIIHLGIALGLGIFTFGLVVSASYSFFLENTQTANISWYIRSKLPQLRWT